MAKYWIAYATVDGRPVHDLCIKHGIWFANAETTQGRLEKIEKGDRIALKGKNKIGKSTILARGVVVDTTSLKPYRLIFVEWKPCEVTPPFKRAQTLHGPYPETHQYVDAIWGNKE